MNKKTEKISDAIGQLDEKIVTAADEKRSINAGRKTVRGKFAKKIWIPAVSAAACAGILCGAALMGGNNSPGLVPVLVETLAEAKYPEAAHYPDESLFNGDYGEAWNNMYEPWSQQRMERLEAYRTLETGSLGEFYKNTCETFLTDGNEKNRVYSPVNVYMALSMLAEITDGESRAQILELAGAESIEALRQQAGNIWKANYRNDGATTSVLANSIWLDSAAEFNSETLNRLAEEYFASAYRGDLASEDTLKALRDWLNKQTDGLLEDAVNGIELPPQTVMALCSTICFHAKWDQEFNPEKNDIKVFHGSEGDIETEFMNNTQEYGPYYWGKDYGAVSLRFADGGRMWLILPDEGKTVEDLLRDGEYMDMVCGSNEWENYKTLIVNCSVPKFDVSSDIDLTKGLMELGVRDVFDLNRSDFTPLSEQAEGLAVGQAEHAARVVIDEKGCTGVAFTVMAAAGAAMPPEEEIDFVLDRPFLFVVTSDAYQPLFVGTVYVP